jgi:hypothetical protein
LSQKNKKSRSIVQIQTIWAYSLHFDDPSANLGQPQPTSTKSAEGPLLNFQTQDPEITARKMGYQNAQAELQSRASGKCECHKDKKLLGYAFLSPNLMLRLSEVTLDRADAQFDIEMFSVCTGFSEGMEPFSLS